MTETLDARVARLQQPGIIDMHFDLLMDLYEKRSRSNVLGQEFEKDLEAGSVGLIGAAIWLEDHYVPELALRVGLDQVVRLHEEVDANPRFAICKSYDDIVAARAANKFGFLITMEGVEPLGNDINLLRAFYELGVRMVGLTHVRRNAAGWGGAFAPSGSSRDGLTPFGRAVLGECERLGIIVDLAHINHAGFEEVLSLTTKPVVISHTNSRKYFDVERNTSDQEVKAVGARGGVVGVNAMEVTGTKGEATLDRYVDHIEHFANLIGVDGVGIGFDFFNFIYKHWTPDAQAKFHAQFGESNWVPDLGNHADIPNLTRKLIERGFGDEDIAKILYGNWMRVFKQML